MELIDLPTPLVETEDKYISLTEGVVNFPVDPEIAKNRAEKASFGLEKYGFNKKEAETSFIKGEEERVRQETAAELDRQKSLNGQRLLAEAARRKGDALTPNDVSYILSLAKPEPTDPATVFEIPYAQEYMDIFHKAFEGEEILEDIPEFKTREFDLAKALGAELIAKREIALKVAEDTLATLKEQSWPGYIADFTKNLSQIYQEIKLRKNVDDVSFFSGLQGTNLQEQAKELLTKPTAVFKDEFVRITNELKADNPQLAVLFAMYVVGQSTTETSVNNLLSLIGLTSDLGIVAGATKEVARGVRQFTETKNAVKELVQSANGVELKKALALEAVGDTAAAGEAIALERINKALAGDTTGQVSKSVSGLTTHLRADLKNVKSAPGRFGEYMANVLENAVVKNFSDLFSVLSTAGKVQRINGVLTPETLKKIKDDVITQYRGVENSVRDIANIEYNQLTNTYTVDMILGQANGKLFSSVKQARMFAEDTGFLEYEVKRKGVGRYIELKIPLDETSNVIRDGAIGLPKGASPNGWAKGFTNWLLGSDTALSAYHNENRKLATYVPNALLKIAEENAKAINQLYKGVVKTDYLTGEKLSRPSRLVPHIRKTRWKDFNRVLAAQVKLKDPSDATKSGVFFKSPQELEEFYVSSIGRMPDSVEIEAYFALRRSLEMDAIMRDIDLYKFRSRAGALNFRVKIKGPDGKDTHTDFFDGVRKGEFPGGEGTLLELVGYPGFKTTVKNLGNIDSKTLKYYKQGLASGELVLIQLYDPETRPFAKLLSKYPDGENLRVQYLITHAVEQRPIQFSILPRRGGGHVIYDYDWYIKSPIIRPERIGSIFRHWYEGDTTLMPVKNRAMGLKLVNHLNTARLLLKERKIAEAKAYVRDNLQMDWTEFAGWFRPKRVDGVLQKARFDIDQEFRLTGRDKTVASLDKNLESQYTRVGPGGKVSSTFRDGTRSGSLARQYQVQFTRERDAQDLYTARDIGTKDSPIYSWEPAKIVDPITAMQRSLSNIIHATWFDDYKIFAVESWINDAKNHLAASLSELRYSPFAHFTKPEWKSQTDKAVISRLMAQRWQVQQLLGTPSSVQTFLHTITQHLADSIYDKFGPKGLNPTVNLGFTKFELDPSWAISKIKDPWKFFRAVTFHAKLGLYAWPQIFVQMQSFSMIYGIAGHRYATPGTAAAWFTQLDRLNPNMIDALDDMLSKLKVPGASAWKPGEFKESVKTLKSTGFNLVQKEVAFYDDIGQASFVKHAGTQFLNWGTWFFREGERMVRLGAWHTAFKEFRDANPTAKITPEVQAALLNRADLLSLNMSRASQSALHTGVFSTTTQFLTYQLRIAELMAGNRITPYEKARVLLLQSALYGIPVGLGVSGIPIADYLKKAAYENGYVVGDSFIESLFTEGVPTTLIAALTGDKKSPSETGGLLKSLDRAAQTGNYYNISERYGTSGIELLKTLLRSDVSILSIVLGASGSVFGGFIKNLDPFYQWVASYMRGDDPSYQLVTEDIMNVFNEVSSLHTGRRGIYAMNTGIWLSKKGQVAKEEISTTSAAFMTLFGLQPLDVADSFLKGESYADRVKDQRIGLNKFADEVRRALRVGKNQPEEAHKILNRAKAYLIVYGYPENKYAEAMAYALKNNEDLVDSLNKRFYTTNLPLNKEIQMIDAYVKTLRNKTK